MKKTVFTFLIALALLLAGCVSQPDTGGAEDLKGWTPELDAARVETLKGWYFQYNRGTNDYSILFGLLDKNDSPVSAAVDVDIKIENDNGVNVYSATRSVTEDDFSFYTSEAAGEEYLAEIRIPESEIIKGNSPNGTVYLTVYKDNSIYFDEVNCEALYCLPLSDIELIPDSLPAVINVKGYDGSVESVIQIEDVSYRYEKETMPLLMITVAGTKISGRSAGSHDVISYKLSDEEGYVVKTGEIFLDSLSEGDKFKDNSIMIFDIEPGKTYTISFSEYSWR